MVDWRPGTSNETLKVRAELLASIRQFFAARQVLEVETPLLANSTTTDVYIQSFEVTGPNSTSADKKYLQTSPEFAMKRLLAADSGPIYQLGKAFRAEESSKRHRPEFTLLEWYHPGFSLPDLMDEVDDLLQTVLECGTIVRFSYRELFQQHLQIDPHSIDFEKLRKISRGKIEFGSDDLTATDYLQMLLARYIEPVLPDYCFIYDYPVAQAALAKIEQDEHLQPVARRFELFGKGMEIANGYFELTDANEQRARFERDNARRKVLGLPEYPIDESLLAALHSGLPSCSGVALGVDRLLMLRLGVIDIQKVISITHQ